MSEAHRRRPERRRASLISLAALLALVLALCLAACGGGDATGSGASSTSGDSTLASGGDVDYKVAVLNVGNATDGAYGQAVAEGAENASEQTGATVDYVGNLNTPDQYVSQGTSFAQAGYNLVLVGHGAMGPVVAQLAEKFPDTTFCHVVLPLPDEKAGLPDNTCYYYARGELGAFRAGALAGMVTKSDVVGANQALVFPGLTVQVNDFVLGVECTNPKAQVLTTVTNNDVDPSPTKTAAEAQIAKGADVLFGATGTAMAGVFQAAAEHPGVLAIGQYVDGAKSAPDVVLASTIVNFQELIPYFVEQAIAGKLPHEQVFGAGMKPKVGYLQFNDAVYGKLPAADKKRYEEIDAAIESEKIEVPGPDTAGEPGDYKKFNAKQLGCS
jgi:basic membrane protein A and related proteins